MPKHFRFYEQTKRSGIESGLSRIGCVLGSACTRMAANVFVLDSASADSNFVRKINASDLTRYLLIITRQMPPNRLYLLLSTEMPQAKTSILRIF